MPSRREARNFALQVLYSNEFLDEDIGSVIHRISELLDHKVDAFAQKLIQTTHSNKPELDQLIHNNLKNNDMLRVGILDKVVVRLALSELLYFEDIPVEVTFNEALELSKDFISNRSSRFINGVLDTIYQKLKEDNKIIKDPIAQLPPSERKHS